MANEQQEEQRITELLGRLGGSTADYPAAMLASRRASFDEQMSALGIGVAAGGAAAGEAAGGAAKAAGLGAAKGAGIAGAAAVTETILKVLIVTLIVAEAIGGIIVYRQRQLHRTVPLVTTVTVSAPSATILTPTETATFTETPTPTGSLTAIITVSGTPEPPSNGAPTATPDSHGNKYGQTPTPPGHRTPGP